MKNFKIFISFILILFCTFKSIAQADCPDFKSGKSRKKITLFKKIKKSESIFKGGFDFAIDGVGDWRSEDYCVDTNGDTVNTVTGQGKIGIGDWDKSWYGIAAHLDVEKSIGKKSTIQVSAAYEKNCKESLPDTFNFNYPTVNMGQYIYQNTENIQTLDVFDKVVSTNFQLGVQYRYYIKKTYKGLYIGPKAAISLGKNKYIDMDNNPQNINYGYIQKNRTVNVSLLAGYQFTIKKHFVFDLYLGAIYKEGINYVRKYNNSEANDYGLKVKYPNTSALNNNYNLAFTAGIAIGYKM